MKQNEYKTAFTREMRHANLMYHLKPLLSIIPLIDSLGCNEREETQRAYQLLKLNLINALKRLNEDYFDEEKEQFLFK